MATHYVRVEDGKVVECLNSLPPNPTGDWREAVEIRPQTSAREMIENPYFVIETDPVEIRYRTVPVTVGDRKNSLKNEIHYQMSQCVEHQIAMETHPDPSLQCNFQTIQDAVEYSRQKLSELDGLTTHEELDTFTFNFHNH